MKKIRLLNTLKCQELLDFKTTEQQRKKYNEGDFRFEDSDFVKGAIDMFLDDESMRLGVNSTDDFDSSKKIFLGLINLDLVQANDKRIWVTLTHGIFYNYTKERWGINENSSNDVIKDRFHFEGVGLRARNQNAIARLWWAARITYEENNEGDPFELTQILWEKQDLYQNLIDRKFSTYPGTLKGFLKFYSKNRHLDIKRDMRRLFRGINALGGVRVLSIFNEEKVIIEIEKLCIFNRIEFNSVL